MEVESESESESASEGESIATGRGDWSREDAAEVGSEREEEYDGTFDAERDDVAEDVIEPTPRLLPLPLTSMRPLAFTSSKATIAPIIKKPRRPTPVPVTPPKKKIKAVRISGKARATLESEALSALSIRPASRSSERSRLGRVDLTATKPIAKKAVYVDISD